MFIIVMSDVFVVFSFWVIKNICYIIDVFILDIKKNLVYLVYYFLDEV